MDLLDLNVQTGSGSDPSEIMDPAPGDDDLAFDKVKSIVELT